MPSNSNSNSAAGGGGGSGGVAPTTPTANLIQSNLFSVSGRKVLITGGGSGLGSYAAVGLALNGAKVYIVGRRAEKLDEVKGDFERRRAEMKGGEAPASQAAAAAGSITVIQGDVSSKDGLKKLVEDYSKHEDHLDALINGAGVIGDKLNIKPEEKDDPSKVQSALWEEDWSNWTNVLNTNTISPYFSTLAFVPLLQKCPPNSLTERGPTVINITSIAALHIARSSSNSHVYQVSKCAEERATQILAGRLAPYGIRVNSIAPGIYPSEMTGHPTPESFMEQAASMVPSLKRSGTPEDFVGAVVFLLSRARAYCSGARLVTDGGRVLTNSAA